MKISQVKEILNSVFEEDDALKYALATNIAKYGRPQSKPSDKPAKLTKGLEKKREKAVKDLKKTMDEGMNDEKAIQAIAAAVSEFANIPNDRFLQGIIRTALGSGYMEEGLSEDKADATRWFSNLKYYYQKAFRELKGEDRETYKQLAKDFFSKLEIDDKVRPVGLNEDLATLEKISDMLDRKFPNLRFVVNSARDRIDVRGYRDDVIDFGEELQGEKIFDYEVFYIEEEPTRGAIVRIIKSDSIMREAKVDYDFSERELIRVLRQLKRGASTEVDMIRAFTKALGREITDDELFREEQTMQGNPNLRMGTYAGRKVIVNTMGTEDMTKWKAVFLNTGKRVDFADVAANIKLDEEKKKKKDRCHRKADQVYGTKTSAYKSGAIVKCRKGMIWKKKK